MMRFLVRPWPFLLLLAFGLTACAPMSALAPEQDDSPAPDAPVAKAAAPVVNSALDERLLYGILIGEIQFQLGHAGDAVAYTLEAARLANDDALYERAAEMAIQAHAADLALQVARTWHDARPDALAPLRYELQVLLATGQLEATQAPLQSLLHTLPDEEKDALIAAIPAFYEGASDRAAAAQIVEQVLDEQTQGGPFAAAAWTAIGRMRLQNNDATGALAAATLGQNANRHAQWPAVLALQLLADGPPATADAAQALIRTYLDQPDADALVQLGYAQWLLERGQYDAAAQQLEQSTQTQPSEPQAWLLKGMLYETMQRDDAARQSLQHYLQLIEQPAKDPDADANVPPQGADRARLALARVALRSKNPADALRWLDAVQTDDAALQMQVQLQRADVLASQGQLDAARQAIRDLPELEPADARIKILAEARLLRDHGQPAQALALLEKALQENPDDTDLLYDAAMTAERLDDLPNMERLLRRLIELDPDAAHAYNALGYSLADRGLRLDEAQALVEKAVELSPKDGYIQDSLGWVHYKQGDLDLARQLLTAAYEQQPDAEIAAHLGEVLWQLGEHAAARAAWQKGLQLDPENPTLNGTMQRLDPER